MPIVLCCISSKSSSWSTSHGFKGPWTVQSSVQSPTSSRQSSVFLYILTSKMRNKLFTLTNINMNPAKIIFLKEFSAIIKRIKYNKPSLQMIWVFKQHILQLKVIISFGSNLKSAVRAGIGLFCSSISTALDTVTGKSNV